MTSRHNAVRATGNIEWGNRIGLQRHLDAATAARQQRPPAMLGHDCQQSRAANDFPVLVPARQRSIFPSVLENQFIDRGTSPETLAGWLFGIR